MLAKASAERTPVEVMGAGTKSAVGRVRPYAEPCFAGDTAYACRSPAARVSFISGHSASAFTAAGLSCAHHLNEEIYGDAGDAVACGASITAAPSPPSKANRHSARSSGVAWAAMKARAA